MFDLRIFAKRHDAFYQNALLYREFANSVESRFKRWMFIQMLYLNSSLFNFDRFWIDDPIERKVDVSTALKLTFVQSACKAAATWLQYVPVTLLVPAFAVHYVLCSYVVLDVPTEHWDREYWCGWTVEGPGALMAGGAVCR